MFKGMSIFQVLVLCVAVVAGIAIVLVLCQAVGIAIPAFFWRVLWICLAAAIAILAIYFVASLVRGPPSV